MSDSRRYWWHCPASAILFGLLTAHFASGPVKAETLIDFEGLGLSETDPVTNQIPGVTFTGAIFVLEGGPNAGFGGVGGNDTPVSGAPAGGGMISDGTGNVSADPANPIELIFDDLVKDLTFTVVDIDAGVSNAHVFNGSIFDADDNEIANLVINAGDPGTGDAVGTLIDFTGFSGIKRLQFSVVNQPAGNSGFTADNFRFTVIPEPGSIAVWSLLSLVLAGYVYQRWPLRNRHK